MSRPWLTQIGQQAIALLDPIYEAQFASIRASRVKAMDETPIKAGRREPGKLKAAYFWPVYGCRRGRGRAGCWGLARNAPRIDHRAFHTRILLLGFDLDVFDAGA